MPDYMKRFHLMFIDESRIEEKKYTCVVGLIVPARRIIRVCKEIDQTIRKCLGKEYSFLDGTLNLKWIRKTRYEKNPFSDLSERQQHSFYRRICKSLDTLNCTLLCAIIEETENYQGAVKGGLYFILERFFYFLRKNDSCGIVISDKPPSGKYDYVNELIESVRSYEYWGEDFKQRIYQDLYFTRDEWDPMVQVTDLLAHTLSSYLGRCLKHISLSELSEEWDFRFKLTKNRYFKMILPLIRKGPDEIITGYGIKC